MGDLPTPFHEETTAMDQHFDGRVFKVEVHQVRLPDGKMAMREIVRHNGGACIVAVDDQENVYLVSQFRKPYEQELLELPAGKLEIGEDPLVCATRELMEETGLRAASMTWLATVYPSPGYCSETLSIYLATELTYGENNLDDGEFLSVHVYPLHEALAMIDRGEIRDAKTQVGLLRARRVLDQRRENSSELPLED
ncbi:MAG: NUDIX hydrolase [Eubacteriales bacterium]|nr:NUDIX hydrolase [Eubacteriales bacterium]